VASSEQLLKSILEYLFLTRAVRFAVVAQVKAFPTTSTPRTVEEKIDRWGDLEEWIAQHALLFEEHTSLTHELQGLSERYSPEKGLELHGKRWTAQFGARRSERTITNQKKAFALLRRFAGSLETAIGAITIPLGAAIDKFIPEELHGQFLRKELSGSRSIKAVRHERKLAA
jgi:hypothetical protein